MNHYNILIASPGTSFDASYVNSLAKTLHACANQRLTVHWMNGQSSLVHHARELTATGGGRELFAEDTAPCRGIGYDTIVWIDSDISWTPDTFFRLVDSKYEVTTGAYLLTDGSTTVHGFNGSLHRDAVKQMAEPIQIQSCGFGFIAMKRGVFERMQRPWFNHEFQKVGEKDGKDIIDCLGEDISWCVKAYRAGIQIWFDPKVLVTHHKTVPLSFT